VGSVKSLASVVSRKLGSALSGYGRAGRTIGHWAGLVSSSVLLSGLLLVAVAPGTSFVAAICTSNCGYGDWPMFHAGATRTGLNSYETALSTSSVASMSEAWTGYVGGNVQSSVAVVGTTIYVGSADHKLYAFAAGCAGGEGTCTPLWTAATGGTINSSPAVIGGVVYVGSADDKLYAFDAAGGNANCTGVAPTRTCTPLWTAATTGIVGSSPVVSGGVVYVGSADDKLYAFDAAGGNTTCTGSAPTRTCTAIWTGTTGGGVSASPSINGSVVYVGSEDDKLYAFATGCNSGGGSCNPLWTATTNGAIFSSPAFDGGVVYIGTNHGTLYAYDAAGGATTCSGAPKVCTAIWTGTTGGFIYNTPAVANGVIYVGSTDDKLYAFAAGCATGGNACTPLWTGATGNEILYSSPAVANGVVYVGSHDNTLYAFDAAGPDAHCIGLAPSRTCSPLWTYVAGGGTLFWDGSPAISHGVLYVGATDFKLHAFYIALDHIVVSPSGAAVAAGAGQAYTAEAYDVYDNDLGDVTASTTFTIDAGTACPSDTCSSIVVGAHTVTGTDGAITATATLNVTAGALDHLVLSPLTATVNAVGTQIYTAEGYDVHGNDLGDVTGSTTFTIDSGTACPADTCTGAVAGGHTVTGTDGTATGTATLTVAGDTFHPVPPVRLLDTRNGNGGLPGKLSAGVPGTFQITGRGGVPSGATAVTANVTIVRPSAASSVYLGPDPIAHPSSATINFNKADITAYGSTIALSNTGSMSATYMAASGTTDLVVDVTGYFTPDSTGDTYHPVTPARLLDTRYSNGLSGKFVTGVPRSFAVWGRGGVPSSATAVTGNLTVVNSTNSWAVYLGPDKVASPTTSTINFAKGQIRANSLTVPLSSTGSLAATFLSSAGNKTDLVFDVTGYYTADLTGARYVPLTPAALLDTRTGNGLSGKFGANAPRSFAVWGRGGVPSNATGVTGIVSIYNQSGSWAIFVGPLDTPKPTTSALNFLKGDNCSNGVTVALSGAGNLSATYIGSAGTTSNVVFVVTGYFVP
jgi:outer membrane protein assembly factor BamB